MERMLLLRNKAYFNNQGIVTVNKISDIPDRDAILFIGTHDKPTIQPNIVLNYLDAIQKMPHRYIVVMGKTDKCLSPNIKIPKNIKKLYCNNFNQQHDTITFLPMGSDFRSIDSFGKADIRNTKRPILCYCNFSIDTHPSRKRIYNSIKDKQFIKFEHMGKFLKYGLSRDDFFKRLNDSKFVICPRGNARDTFRFYDTIYSGAIPIVIRERFHDTDYFKGVPILFLKDESEFETLTEDFLNKSYLRLSRMKRTYYPGLDMNNLISCMNGELEDRNRCTVS